MSPEQIRDSDEIDARADVWALGVTIFELIAGRRPFSGVGSALVASIISDPIPELASFGVDVDPRLEALIGSCLERDPALRPSDATDLGARLDALTSNVALPAAPEGKKTTAWGKWAALGAIGAAIAAAIMLSTTKTKGPASEAVTEPSAAVEDQNEREAPALVTGLGAEHRITAIPTTSVATEIVSAASAEPSLPRSNSHAAAPLMPIKKVSAPDKSTHASSLQESAPVASPSANVTKARSPLDDREF